MATYQHMLKRKGRTEFISSGYINIPPWKEGFERRISFGGEQIYVRVLERSERERMIYTDEIDAPRIVELPDEKRVIYAVEIETR